MINLNELRREREMREARSKLNQRNINTPISRPSYRRSLRSANQLKNTHRSIRLAHSLGLFVFILFGGLFSFVLFGSWRAVCICIILGTGLARSGGGWLHNTLLESLKESSEPTDAELVEAQHLGFSSLEGLQNPIIMLTLEKEIALENLAFVCTYGKRNCLTNEMYTGQISLGKIFSLVYAKLSQGIVRCN
eukprot:GSMAST32.ASY1.ANO1.1799.1 assembled CDS